MEHPLSRVALQRYDHPDGGMTTRHVAMDAPLLRAMIFFCCQCGAERVHACTSAKHFDRSVAPGCISNPPYMDGRLQAQTGVCRDFRYSLQEASLEVVAGTGTICSWSRDGATIYVWLGTIVPGSTAINKSPTWDTEAWAESLNLQHKK